MPAGRSPVHNTFPVSASYARTLPSPPAWNSSPVAVVMMPRAVTIDAGVAAALRRARGSSPAGTCHLIVPVFRSYAVSVEYGGLTIVLLRP